jgi:hypothetical protein
MLCECNQQKREASAAQVASPAAVASWRLSCIIMGLCITSPNSICAPAGSQLRPPAQPLDCLRRPVGWRGGAKQPLVRSGPQERACSQPTQSPASYTTSKHVSITCLRCPWNDCLLLCQNPNNLYVQPALHKQVGQQLLSCCVLLRAASPADSAHVAELLHAQPLQHIHPALFR